MIDAAAAQRIEDRLAALTTEQHAMRAELQQVVRVVDRIEARREATEELDAAVRRLPEAVGKLTTRVESLEARQEASERPVMVHDRPDTRPRIWESEDGRRVIWWVCAALVLFGLSIGGGLTFADLTSGSTVGFSVEGAP